MTAAATTALLLTTISHSIVSPTAFVAPQSSHLKGNGMTGIIGSSKRSPLLLHLASENNGNQQQQQPGKGDLYSDDELFDLLNLHLALNPDQEDNDELNQELNVASIPGIHDLVLETIDDISSSETNEQTNNVASSIPGIHDLVLETIDDISSSSRTNSNDQTTDNQLRYDNLQSILRERKPKITAIATDVDGTLLSSGQDLHPSTRDAIVKAIDQCYSNTNEEGGKIKHFFPATGKSRQGAIGSLGDDVGPLLHKCPGVYIQGLYCIDREGNVVFEKKLSPTVVKEAEQLVADCKISICGYDGDNLYTTEQTDVVVSLSEFYGEPTVQLVLGKDGSSKIKLSEHENGLHKLLIMDEDTEMLTKVVRPKLEDLAKRHDVTVTQALPTMLELLPGGCSKAYGVQKLCEALDIDPRSELLALGDAENDAEMLEMACIGVAVGNACPRARSAADFIMTERNDEGGAGLAMELFGFDN